jgi:hypothetical protein
MDNIQHKFFMIAGMLLFGFLFFIIIPGYEFSLDIRQVIFAVAVMLLSTLIVVTILSHGITRSIHIPVNMSQEKRPPKTGNPHEVM